MSEHTLADRVREDFMGGVRSGVNGTPTFFINGARYDESWDEDSLRGALEQGALSCLASMSRRAAACEFSCPWNFLMVGKKPFIGPDRMRKLSLFASAWLPRTIISPT